MNPKPLLCSAGLSHPEEWLLIEWARANWAIPLLKQMDGVAGLLLTGWQVNGIFLRQVGG